MRQVKTLGKTNDIKVGRQSKVTYKLIKSNKQKTPKKIKQINTRLFSKKI
jgi:hypothetical protein